MSSDILKKAFQRDGQSLIEVFVALVVGVAIIGGMSGAISVVLRTGELADKGRSAAILNDSLFSDVHIYAEGNWTGIYNLSKGSGNRYHIVNSSGNLAVQSGLETSITINGIIYSRSFYVENVSRDGSNNIESVYNSVNDDPSTQKITVETSFTFSGSTRTISAVFYATRWRNFAVSQTNWSGGSGQEGPITAFNSQFTSQTNVDFTTAPGSITPVTINLNNVYVADLDNDRIQKFNDSGTFLLKWGNQGTANGEFMKPYGVAIDSLNNVYIADQDNDRIQKFDSNGNFLLKWGTGGSGDGQFGHPQGIAIDGSNNVYVVDLDRDRIQKFDSSGNFIRKWGTNGNGDGQFDKPKDVAVDSLNNVYVTDQDNNRIQKFDSNGNFLLKWGTNGTGDGQLKKPVGIGVDNSDNVYVADRDNDRIQKFNSNGNFLLKWGATGGGNGEFQTPQGVTADQDNYIYIADGNNHRVQKFDSSGNFVAKWGKAGGASGNGDGEFNHPRGLEQVPANCILDCVLISSIFDSGFSGGVALNTIMWQGNQPSGTGVRFQVASSNSSSGPWNYLGSDGSIATHYAPAGPNIQTKLRLADHNNKRYFRYKIFFDVSGAVVPRVDDVIIGASY